MFAIIGRVRLLLDIKLLTRSFAISLEVGGLLNRVVTLLASLLVFSSMSADNLPVRQRTAPAKPYCSFELTLSKNDVMLEERVPFKVRLTLDRQAYAFDVRNLAVPTIAGLHIEPLSAVKKGQDVIQGSNCLIYEWDGVLYPQKPGQLMIDPFQVAIEQRSSGSRGFFNFFTSNMVSLNSNGGRIYVRALPFHPKSPKAVGTFQTAYLEVDRSKISVGQAIVVRYHVTGLGNLHLCKHPELDLPEGIKCYPSTANQEPGGYFFEYALQPTQDGIIIIPAQTFIYFDPDLRLYQELATGSVRLFVEPSSVAAVPFEQLQTSLVNGEDQDLENDSVQQVVCTTSWVREQALPDYLIALCLLGALMLFCLRILRGIGSRFFNRIAAWRAYRKAIRNARYSLVAAKKAGDITIMYVVFKDLESVIDWDTIKAVDSVTYDAWHTFWCQLQGVRFNQQSNVYAPESLFLESQRWIRFFEMKR